MQLMALKVHTAIQAYIILIFVWVMGSWFPQWQQSAWYRFVGDIVKPYMDIFRPLKLRAGMVDFTPMAAIFVLFLLQRLIAGAVHGGGV